MIPDTMKEEIFKPFVRLDKEDEVTTGTGIGLALSRSLAELHQGSLMMEKGEEVNCFCLTLPVNQDSTITLSAENVSQVEENSCGWEQDSCFYINALKQDGYPGQGIPGKQRT